MMFSLDKMLYIWKSRMANVLYRYDRHFKDAPGRYDEFKAARRKVLLHP